MSRIHDALKKAQQERAASAPAGPAEVLELGESLRRLPEPEAVQPAPAEAAAETALTIEDLRAHCAAPPWNPDVEKMVFLDGGPQQGSEEMRTLRSKLYQIREQRPLKSILVTSALPAEGKSFISGNLAQAFVRQHERRCLLIDADLRRSRLHLTLGAPGEPGLSDFLRGQAELLEVIQRGPGDNFFFIPGGKPASNPAELIANGRMEQLLAQVAPAFDWIVMDSPPVAPIADASILGTLCDGVLLVVQAAATPLEVALKARSEFRPEKLLGVVLNQADGRVGYSSYYYHYYGAGKNGQKK